MEQLAKNQLHTAEITGYTSEGVSICGATCTSPGVVT